MTSPLRLLQVAFSLALLAPAANAQTIIGITDSDSLIAFSAATPGFVTSKTMLTGIPFGQTIAGMDYRPATGELFALGYNSATGAAQLYTINTSTSSAVPVGSAITLSLGAGSIGFDFNPTVDRIRVVGANRSNYRLNPITGGIAATDGNLAYALTDPNALTLPSVGAVAYTNSFPGTSSVTSLYDYDESLNVLSLQNPPNNGTLNTIGSSGITVNPTVRTVDMDIWFNPSTKTNTAYLIANTGSRIIDSLYTINLTTGAATSVGSPGLAVKDIAVIPGSLAAGPFAGRGVYALAGSRVLVSFDAATPKQLRSLGYITGVDSAHTLVGLDFRPADGQLYALGYTGGAFNTYRLYRINPATAVATPISSGNDTMALGNTFDIGFDFNPTVDRIRVVSALNGANYRLNPNNGLIAATDSNLRWTAGDVNASRAVRVSTVAYTKSYAGATATTLNAINDSGAVFVTVNPPNNGRLNTVASSIFGAGIIPFGPSDLDYFYDSTSGTDVGYLAANTGNSAVDLLYTLNPTTGGVTLVDTIGYGLSITDIAVMPQFRNIQIPGVGIKGINPEFQPAVYPNPATETVSVRLPDGVPVGAGNFSVTDITGRMMMQGKMVAGAKEAQISLKAMPQGIYLLHVQGYAPVRFSKQ